MAQLTPCNVKGVAHSDETKNGHPTLQSALLYEVFLASFSSLLFQLQQSVLEKTLLDNLHSSDGQQHDIKWLLMLAGVYWRSK